MNGGSVSPGVVAPCGCRCWFCLFTLLCIRGGLLSASSLSQNSSHRDCGGSDEAGTREHSHWALVGTEAAGRFGRHHGCVVWVCFCGSLVRSGNHELAPGVLMDSSVLRATEFFSSSTCCVIWTLSSWSLGTVSADLHKMQIITITLL